MTSRGAEDRNGPADAVSPATPRSESARDGAARRLVDRFVQKKSLFLGLSCAGVAVGVGLAIAFGIGAARDPSYELAPRAVLVLLVLLNARQSLKQFRLASAIERTRTHDESPTEAAA